MVSYVQKRDKMLSFYEKKPFYYESKKYIIFQEWKKICNRRRKNTQKFLQTLSSINMSVSFDRIKADAKDERDILNFVRILTKFDRKIYQ